MAKRSAGILMYKRVGNVLQVFLVHPGGPLFVKKDTGFWSIPKGEYEDSEDPLMAAKREFYEETGSQVKNECIPLAPITLKSGKTVTAWASPGDIDAAAIRSNAFLMEWPPRSGKRQAFPEVDRGAWFTIEEARLKLNEAQVALLDQLIALQDCATLRGNSM